MFRIKRQIIFCNVLVVVLALNHFVQSTVNADWPTYRGNIARTGSTESKLPGRLDPLWSFDGILPPHPAWSQTARGSYWQQLDKLESRVVDDMAFHPVIASGRVVFASSADDHVYCLDANSGDLLWMFPTEAPVRFTPQIVDKRVYFGSDDGKVYCVTINSGTLVWKTKIGERNDRIIGNGRIIDRHPIRTSVLVDKGTVYACAGLMSSQKVYAAALDAETGKIVWKQSNLNRSPQGYLLASEKYLFVPSGRATPFMLNRLTGQLEGNLAGSGGTFAVLDEQNLISGPGTSGNMQAGLIEDRSRLANFQGLQMVISKGMSYLLSNSHISALDRAEYLRLSMEYRKAGQELEQAKKRKDIDQRNLLQQSMKELTDQMKQCLKWKIALADGYSMILAGQQLLVGSNDKVLSLDTKTGKQNSRIDLQGRVLSLAASDSILLASTSDGSIHAFGKHENDELDQPKNETDHPEKLVDNKSSDSEGSTFLLSAIQSMECKKGFALFVKPSDLEPIQNMIEHSEFHCVIVGSDAVKLKQIRKWSLSKQLYGKRITCIHKESDHLFFTDCFTDWLFNLIIVSTEQKVSLEECKRVLRPSGGLLVNLNDRSTYESPSLDGAGEWTHQYGNLSNTSNSGDKTIDGDLEIQWFGEPGPQYMVDRHLRGPAPLYKDGMLFVFAENRIIGIDAYNGTIRWNREFPSSQRYSIPYDCGYAAVGNNSLFLANGKDCFQIDCNTGQNIRSFPMSKILQDLGATRNLEAADTQQKIVAQSKESIRWGYVGVEDGSLFASGMYETASRTKPSRDLIEQDYHSGQSIVCSNLLFSLKLDRLDLDQQDKDDLQLQNKPVYMPVAGMVLNPTICITKNHFAWIEIRNISLDIQKRGRISSSDCLPKDTFLVVCDRQTGHKISERCMEDLVWKNNIYLMFAKDRWFVIGCNDIRDRAFYNTYAFDDSLDKLWERKTEWIKNGLGHGEQIQHPVAIQQGLVVEPYVLDYETGEMISPITGKSDWLLKRPGHGCGTLSGAGDMLFFRGDNPIALDLCPIDTNGKLSNQSSYTRLAPSRPGCWINILPAGGLVMIPESSASCVCQFPLQTSMVFKPAKLKANENK